MKFNIEAHIKATTEADSANEAVTKFKRVIQLITPTVEFEGLSAISEPYRTDAVEDEVLKSFGGIYQTITTVQFISGAAGPSAERVKQTVEKLLQQLLSETGRFKEVGKLDALNKLFSFNIVNTEVEVLKGDA